MRSDDTIAETVPREGLWEAQTPQVFRRQLLLDAYAGRAGFQVGDIIQSMEGTPLKDRETLNRLLAEKRWADDAVFVVSRGGSTVSVTAVFRREMPEAK